MRPPNLVKKRAKLKNARAEQAEQFLFIKHADWLYSPSRQLPYMVRCEPISRFGYKGDIKYKREFSSELHLFHIIGTLSKDYVSV